MATITKGQEPMPGETLRWAIAERFGWSLEYVDALRMGDLHEFLEIEEGKHAARHSYFVTGAPRPKVERQ